MPLSDSTLSNLLETELKAVYGNPSDTQRLKDFCDAIAKAVVDHITSDGVAKISGVQSGGSTISGVIE